MLGVSIKECKSAKIKNISRLIHSTKTDILNRLPFEKINFSEVDFVVQNGIKKKARHGNVFYENVELISKENNIPILIRELPVIRQICLGHTDKHVSFDDRWIRFSWNSFFMDEGIHPYDPSYDRWSELQRYNNIIVRDWQSNGHFILFCLQLNGDSALNRLIYNDIDYNKYCEDTINKIKNLTDRPILVRGHPLDPAVVTNLKRKFVNDNKVTFSSTPNIYHDLNVSHCMITYNSTSCVESILHGLPTIVLDSSAVAFPVSNKLEDIENLKEFDRTEWLKKIAFMQWQGKELTDGYVWNLLKTLVWK
jgi:hypothetical protein